MKDKLRVLIADDQAISREGIQRILEKEKNITVVGTVHNSSDVLPQIDSQLPDLVILDLMWHHDDKRMSEIITRLHTEHPNILIIGITAYDNLMVQAKDAGATWVLSKSISKRELVNLVQNILAKKEESDLSKATEALRRIDFLPGNSYREYEDDVYTILSIGFYPHLTNSMKQSPTLNGSYRRDIIFTNYSAHNFWRRMSERHNATYVVFEIKNVKRLKVGYVTQTAGYLNPWIGRLGFLVSNVMAGESMIRRAIDIYNAENKVILFLGNEDLKEIIRMKELGNDPTDLIQLYYDNFMMLI